jgi:hypothetical protein
VDGLGALGPAWKRPIAVGHGASMHSGDDRFQPLAPLARLRARRLDLGRV